jgi:adenylate kinase family enzyme
MGCSNKPSVGEKPRIVFVIGGPGCGKGTQCKRIVQNFKYVSFSTGDLLRQYVKDKKDGYEDIDNQMKEGKLISSATLMKVLKEYVMSSTNKKILVDGYPRNQENIDEWEKQMEDLVEVKGALYIEVSNEEMTKRLLGRNEGRADDNEETIKKRLTTFERQTKPIVSYFEKKGNLIKIDGMKTVDEISKDIADKFKEKGLN